LACDREQAQIVLGYVKAFFEEIPDLKALIVRETRLGLELASRVNVTVATNSFRQTRGRTISLAIFDECSFWRSEETVNPDRETYRAVLPGLATLPGSMLIAISSPYRKSGLLYEKWKQHYGKNTADVLVIQATSRMLNPTLDQGLVDAALEDDPQAARSEWLGEWRNDLASFIGVEMIEACTDRGVTVRPPRPGVRYVAFVDAASGVGQDAFALGIAHRDKEEIVLDLVHEVRPPFSPSQTIAEICALLRGGYNVTSVTGDKYAPGFVAEGFLRPHGVRYVYSERDRSQIYVEALPLLTSGRARLVENKKLALQFASLERRTSSGGKDRIDHGMNGHDDLANAASGALVEIATRPQAMVISDAVMAAARNLRRRERAQRELRDQAHAPLRNDWRLCAGQVRRTQAVGVDRFRRQGAGVGGRTARCDRYGALAKADGARHQGGTLGGRALLATAAADLQKKLFAPLSNAGPMSRPLAPIGARCNQASILEGWSLSTRSGLRPT
jgi:hypothetical protein